MLSKYRFGDRKSYPLSRYQFLILRVWPNLEYAIGTDKYPGTPLCKFIYHLRTARQEAITTPVGTILVLANAQTSIVKPSLSASSLYIASPFRYHALHTRFHACHCCCSWSSGRSSGTQHHHDPYDLRYSYPSTIFSATATSPCTFTIERGFSVCPAQLFNMD